MAIKKKILVTGANGQLGQEIKVLSVAYTLFDFIFLTRDELSIDDPVAVKKFFNKHSIQYCINCAAYTAVDKAETEPEKALSVNGTAVGILAKICKEHHTQFIHVSTDYVFDGTATSPYKENHPVNPLGVYGDTKLKGEQLALKYNPDTIIIRTSWVYSAFGNNFVKTMLRLMKERDSINVVKDQIGRPTYAGDLAAAIMNIVSKGYRNNHFVRDPGNHQLFHYSNAGDPISWYEFALAIKELSGQHCKVNPIPSTDYPTPAKRPSYSVLDLSKTRHHFFVTTPLWKESLQKCLLLII